MDKLTDEDIINRFTKALKIYPDDIEISLVDLAKILKFEDEFELQSWIFSKNFTNIIIDPIKKVLIKNSFLLETIDDLLASFGSEKSIKIDYDNHSSTDTSITAKNLSNTPISMSDTNRLNENIFKQENLLQEESQSNLLDDYNGHFFRIAFIGSSSKIYDVLSIYTTLSTHQFSSTKTTNSKHYFYTIKPKELYEKNIIKFELFGISLKDIESHSNEKIDGVVVVLEPEKNKMDFNTTLMSGIGNYFRLLKKENQFPYVLMLDNLELSSFERLTSFEIAKVGVETGFGKNVAEVQVNIIETAIKTAIHDLRIVKEEGHWEPKDRPQSIQRIIQPIQMVIRVELIYILRQRQEEGENKI